MDGNWTQILTEEEDKWQIWPCWYPSGPQNTVSSKNLSHPALSFTISSILMPHFSLMFCVLLMIILCVLPSSRSPQWRGGHVVCAPLGDASSFSLLRLDPHILHILYHLYQIFCQCSFIICDFIVLFCACDTYPLLHGSSWAAGWFQDGSLSPRCLFRLSFLFCFFYFGYDCV